MTQEEGRCIALEINRGNRNAVGELVAAYQDRLFTYAFHMLGGSDDALDVTQEAFVKAYTTLSGKYDAERCRTLEVRPWLYRIVRNLALNRLRSAQTKRRRAGQHEGKHTSTGLRNRKRPDQGRSDPVCPR